MKKIYLHVGLHKTATTYLQNLFYKNTFSDSCVYNPKEILDLVVICCKFPERKNNLIPLIHKKINSLSKDKILISREILSGNLFDFYRDNQQSTALINDIFGKYDLNIILVLREQLDWIVSVYKQSIQLHHYQFIIEFLAGRYKKNNKEYFCANYKDLDFYNIIKTEQ